MLQGEFCQYVKDHPDCGVWVMPTDVNLKLRDQMKKGFLVNLDLDYYSEKPENYETRRERSLKHNKIELTTQKGAIRVFKTIDAIYKMLRSEGIREFSVSSL